MGLLTDITERTIIPTRDMYTASELSWNIPSSKHLGIMFPWKKDPATIITDILDLPAEKVKCHRFTAIRNILREYGFIQDKYMKIKANCDRTVIEITVHTKDHTGYTDWELHFHCKLIDRNYNKRNSSWVVF